MSMESLPLPLPKIPHPHLSLNHRHSSFPTSPFSSLSFTSLPPPLPFPSSSFQLPSITASSSPKVPSSHKSNNPLPHLLQTLTPLFSPLLETTRFAIAATALFFMHLHLTNPVIAAPLVPPTMVEPTAENLSDEETESVLEEQLRENPSDIEALKSLMEIKIRARKIDEAILVIDSLIELEPEEFEWPLLKAHMYMSIGDLELAKNGFEDVLKEDPFRVEAYHGLLMAISELNEPTEDLMKRVEEGVEFWKKQNGDLEVRDFKLLIAQIKVMEGDFADALKVYEELVKEEPSDFRPYLCQGIIYTMLRKKGEAEKQFEKFRSLVPKDHPYREYFEDNTKVFLQNLERGGMGANS